MEEARDPRCPIDVRRFINFFGDRQEAGEKDDHKIGGKAPGGDDNNGRHGKTRIGEPINPAQAEGAEELIDQTMGVKKESPHQANRQNRHDIGQKHAAHKKPGAPNSRIDDQGEPKSQNGNGDRGTDDIEQRILEGLEKHRILKNAEVVAQADVFGCSNNIVSGKTQINGPTHGSVFEKHEEKDRRQDKENAPELNPGTITELPRRYGDLSSPYGNQRFTPMISWS